MIEKKVKTYGKYFEIMQYNILILGFQFFKHKSFKIQYKIMRNFIVTVNNQQYDVVVEEVKNVKTQKPTAAQTSVAAPAPAKAAAPSVGGAIKINSPMPGSIWKINVNVGDVVKKGQALLILEAMKMENEIGAPADGKIVDIKVTKGQSVNLGQVLIEMK
jgi:biotin carboxyl carrier protein